MFGRQLRLLRILVSLLVFGTTALLFLDFAGSLQAGASNGVLFPQVTPSVLRLIEGSFLAGSSLLFVLLLTLLWGRVFCSCLCPLGLLQDAVSRFAAKPATGRRHRHFHHAKAHEAIRYGVLLAFVIGLLTGSVLLVGLLDPYSHFGRIMVLLVRPAIVALNNLLANASRSLGGYAPPLLDDDVAVWPLLLLPLAASVLILGTAALRGRLFCNTLCPVGTLLGVCSRFSLFRIKIEANKCNGCGKCSLSCKAGCIDLESRTLDFSRCVACFNCIAACRHGAIDYASARSASTSGKGGGVAPGQLPSFPMALQTGLDSAPADPSRRSFIATGGGWLAGLAGSGRLAEARVSRRDTEGSTVFRQAPVVKERPVLAPGAKGTDHLRSSCIACQLCVSSCPTQVLQPSLLQFGGGSALQPHLDFQVAFCAYECTRCGEVCPTQAIGRLTSKAKKRTKIGEVRLIEEYCIAVTEKTTCGACADYCPTRAVYMVQAEGGGLRPKLDPPVCVGCGACEHVCPTRPYRAILVEGEHEHRKAKPPRNFPFHHYREQEEFPF
jgi:ferredoxin